MAESTFAAVVSEAFARHPKLKALGTEVVEQLTVFFISWPSLADYPVEGLVSDFGLTEEVAAIVKRVASSKAAEAAQFAAETVQVSVAASVEEAEAEAAPSKWAHLLKPVSSVGLSADTVMAARVNPKVMGRLAKAAAVVVIFGHGLDQAVTESVLAAMDIEDPDITDKFYQFRQDVLNGTYLPMADLETLAKQMSGMFGPHWNKIMDTVAELANLTTAHELLQGAGVASTNQIAPQLGALRTMIPSVNEHMGNQFRRGFGTAIADRGIRLDNALLDLIKAEDVQRAAGVYTGDPEEGALKFLEKYVDQHARTVYRLAIVSEALVSALGECPANASEIDREYLLAVGSLAMQYRTLYTLVEQFAGGASAVPGAEPFQPRPTVAAQPSVTSPQRRQRWGISIDFAISLNRS